MKNSNFIQDIEAALTTYQAWGFGDNKLLAQSHTLRDLMRVLQQSGNFWTPVEEIVVVVCTGDTQTFQAPQGAYSQKTRHGMKILPFEAIPEHVPVDETTSDRDMIAELLYEQEFFRSQGYPEYDAFEILQKGQTSHDWIEEQAKSEGKSLDDFYKQLFEGQTNESDDLDATQKPQEQTENLDEVSDFASDDVADARQRTVASVVRRQGQPEFRQSLIKAYDLKCAISGCDAIAALEAAHIMPYRGLNTNQTSNGLLLRADLHTLFDLGLIAVDTVTMTVLISDELSNTTYTEIAGKPLQLPKEEHLRPNRKALDIHTAQSKVR